MADWNVLAAQADRVMNSRRDDPVDLNLKTIFDNPLDHEYNFVPRWRVNHLDRSVSYGYNSGAAG